MERIVIDARGLALGHAQRGVGRVIREIVVALDRAGLDAHVVGPPTVRSLLAGAGLTWMHAHARAIDGVLTPGAFSSLAPTRVLRLAPTAPGPLDPCTIALCHDLIPLAHLDQYFPLHRRLRAPLARAAYLQSVELYRRSLRVAAVSRQVADDVVKRLGVPPTRVDVLPLAASDAFHLDAAAAADDDEAEPAAHRDEVVWVLGGLNANKNLDVVLTTWSGAARSSLPELVIVGALPPRVVWRIRALARLAGARAPTFLGRLSDDELAFRMRRARCVIVPSRAEGFGLPVVEARAAGARVIASDVPVLREVGDDDVTYVSPDDANAWRQAIHNAQPARAPRHRRRWGDVGRELIALLRS